MDGLRHLTALLARLAIAALFLASAYDFVTDWGATLQRMREAGVPSVEVTVPLAVAACVLGGLAVLVGFLTRLGAVLLLAFVVATTWQFHRFWTSADPATAQVQQSDFLQYLAIAGGLLLLLAFGPGAASVDGRKRPAGGGQKPKTDRAAP
ncbi:MAG: DoxX family protein [Planctomycetes bacterium]|nr:DoxX family protein [Planctomycetota bacterium]